MIEDLLTLTADVDWLEAVVIMHYAALAMALTGVVIGDGLGARMLFLRGPPVSARAVSFAHTLVLIGLFGLLLSGSALLVTKHTLATLPPKLVFKLGLAVLLSLNALLLQQFLLPLTTQAQRPLAASLSILETFRAIAIGVTSLTCWTGMTAVAFVPALQALPAVALYQGFAFAWLVLFTLTATVTLMIGTIYRSFAPRYPMHLRNPPRPDKRVSQPSHVSPLGFPQALPAGVPPLSGLALQSPSHMRLSERFTNLAGMPPVNDNPREAAGARVQLHAHVAQQRSNERHRPVRSSRQPETRHVTDPDVASAVDETYALKDVRKACRSALMGVGVISMFINLLMLTGPLFMLQVYDRVLTSKSVPTLTALFGLTIALFVFMGVLEAVRSRLLVRIGLRIDRLLSSQVFDAAIAIREPNKRTEQAQLLKDLRNVRQFISGAGATAFFDMPWAPFYFALLFVFHWTLGALALGGAVVLVVLSSLNELLSRKPVLEAAHHATDGERLYEAGRRGGETLQAMGMARVYRNAWLTTHCDEVLSQTKGADVSGVLTVMTKTLRLLLQSAVLAAGALLVLQNIVSPGIMIASSIIMSRALSPIETAIGNWRSFITTRQGYARLAEAFTEAPVRPSRLPLATPQGKVRVEGLFASPIGLRDPVLKGLDFQLEPGDALGVLGASGSGKSTLARVLVGVWPTLKGHVRLDGAALHHWPPEQLGRHVGYLPQAVELFDGTVADNISRFDPEASPQDIIAAARMANVHDMIQALPEGYNTLVGDGGTVLSGGHRQRVALARALYRQPAFVVLDEPNSNLDQDGEAALSQSIDTLRQAGSTVVVLAHRRKALEHVNLLLVLKDGRQAAFGPKDDILKPAGRSRAASKSSAAKTSVAPLRSTNHAANLASS
ncbi:MAG: type I secretion system permease/ATPase [Pseudomonadota bacterium]